MTGIYQRYISQKNDIYACYLPAIYMIFSDKYISDIYYDENYDIGFFA